MSQSSSKSASCLQIWGTLEVSVRQDTSPCFKAWSTLALFDYFQNETPLSAKNEPDPCARGNQSQTEQSTEAVRAELQELLRRVYAESWRVRAGKREKNQQ